MSDGPSAENDAPPCCPGAGTMAHVRGCRNHPEYERQARRCPVHHLPHTPDTWMSACTCPSTAHGIEEAD